MAITDIVLSGKIYQDDGDAVNGATVALLETGTSTQEATTTSDPNGAWSFTEDSLDATYDIKITSGTSVRYILWSDEITTKGVDTASLKVRGVEGAAAPIYLFADQADDAGDGWRIQASASDTLAIGSDKAVAGTIIDYLTVTNGANAAASTVTVGGILTVTTTLDVNGTADFDVTDFDIASSGDIDLLSTNDAAAAIYLRENAGTSGTIKIHADQGTSVTEGAESINILSDAGGVGIRSTANLANAVNITVDGGTTSSMTLFNDTGTTATEGSASIQLLSDVGGINIKSGLNGANAILLTADGGTSETIVLHADQGTGTGSIELLSDAGGIELDAGTDIILDAGGADIFLKDDGTLFGTLNNNSGELLIKSSSSGTTAATFSGANVTFAGTVDATTDFTVGSTVITDDSIVMTPSASDTVTIAGATHGILNVTTVDAAGTAADVNIDADGEIVIDAADAAGAIFKIAGTAQLSVIDGAILPTTDNDIDLGSSSYQFKDAYINGTLEADAVTIGGTNVVTGSLITTLGTISAGVWEGTDVAVAHGGTGASSLTDGGVLLGSGTSAVTAMAVLADGEMIVGDGTTAPVAESGATLRTSIGVGTGNSPQFTGIELGHASDTTIARSGSGAITVEGTQVLLAGAALTGSTIDASTDFTVGDTVITDGVITDSTGLSLAAAVDLGSNTLTSTGSMQIRTIDYSDGDLAITIADGGGITAAAGITSTAASNTFGATSFNDANITNVGSIALDTITSDGSTVGFGTDGSGEDVYFYSATSGDHLFWDSSDEKLVITGTNDALALNVADGFTQFAESVYIGDSANAQSTLGLTINQGTANDNALTLKTSDTQGGNHGLTSSVVGATAETDDYFSITKNASNQDYGGVTMRCIAYKAGGVRGLDVQVYSSHGSTATTTSGMIGSTTFDMYAHNNSNALEDVAADGNVFSIRAYTGGAISTRVGVNVEGDIYTVTSAQTFDEYDDAQMVRALDQVKGDVIRDRWDDYVQYNEQALIDAKVLGAPVAEGGMTNVTQLQRLHNGAIWQGYVRQQELQERVIELEGKILALEGVK